MGDGIPHQEYFRQEECENFRRAREKRLNAKRQRLLHSHFGRGGSNFSNYERKKGGIGVVNMKKKNERREKG